MYLLSRIRSGAAEVLVTFLIFSLSTGVVGGVILYLDSIGPDVLAEMSENVSVHMQVHFQDSFYDQNATTVQSHKSLILEQEYVSAAECISLIEINDANVSNKKYARSVVLGIEETFVNNFPGSIDLSEDNDMLNASNCYIQREWLVDEGLRIGDNITISVPIESGLMNRTFTIASTFESSLFMRMMFHDTPTFSSRSVVLSRDALLHEFASLPHTTENGLVDRIWVNFDTKQLLAEDSSRIVPLLRDIEKRLEQRILPDAAVVDFQLIGVFYEYSTWATSMRVIALAFSIPSIIMAVMLIQYNSKLEADAQRRSVGALKTRGASGLQAIKWILSVSLFTGLIGSLGAILIAIISAILAGGVKGLLLFDISKIRNFVVILQPQSILLLFLFSFAAGLLVAIPSAIRAFLMSPTEAHDIVRREDTMQEGGLNNPVYQVGATCVSGIILIPLMGSLDSFADFSAGFAVIGVTFVVFLAIFVVGLTYLLARSLARLKSWILLRIKVPSLAATCRLLGKTSLTYKRSEAVALVFISLVFTAGVFSSLSANSGYEHMKDLFMFDVGADVVIDVRSGSDNVTLDMISNILSVEGVSHASGLMWTSARVTYQEYWRGYLASIDESLVIYGIQPREFSESAFLKPEFGYYGDPRVSIPILGESEEYAITNFKPISYYDRDSFGNSYPVLSDHVSVELIGPNGKHILNCTIINVLGSTPSSNARGLYGDSIFTGATYMPGEDIQERFVMLDINTLQKYLNISHVDRFYIDLTADANYTQAMRDLGNVSPSSFDRISSPYPQIDAILDSRAGESIYGEYTLNVIFSILYLTAGITLVAKAKVRGLRKNLSILRALGEQHTSIIKAMLIDSIIAMALGAIAGGFIGFILTYIVLQMPLTYLGLSTQVTWERLPLVISTPVVLIICILALAFVFSTAISFLVVRNGLESNIAEDIQQSG
jgi:ABC-type lipoprotein release transport system permease subunit